MLLRKDIPRYTALLAVLIGLVFAVAPAAVYFALSWQSLRVSLEKEAEIKAHKLSLFVAANPLMWQFDEIRLKHILEADNARTVPECRIAHDRGGIVAMSHPGGEAAHPDDLPWPVVSRSHPVWDAGTAVGWMEIRISLRPLVLATAALGVASALFSAAALTFFFLYPWSELRKALDALWEMKERAQATLHSITDGVITMDTGRNILLMNRIAEIITGWPSREAMGKPVGEVIPLDFPVGGAAPPAGAPARAFRTRVSRIGEERLIEAVDTPVLDRSGKAAGSVLVIRDVTEKERVEDELLRGKKLESLGVLAGGIAHDFNNLLTGILGNISLAKEMVDPGKRAQKRLEEAERAALKAKDLSTRLLAFSRGGKPIRKEISAEEALRDAIDLALRGTGVRAEFRIAQGIWAVTADAGQLGQVFHNLAINAAEAMPAGGILRVSMENARVREGEVPHVMAGSYVKIVMADEGSGIPADILPKIFDPYFTTKAAGSGLGLTTCYTILKNHGGNIFADSAIGAGTTFRIYLPATGEVPRDVRPDPTVAALPGNGTVLLMDDEELVLDVVGEMLTQLGYTPVFSRHGEEAISKYEEASRGPGAYDLVILDLVIPGGMGGKETAARILEKHPDARIVVSSGYSNDPVMAGYKEHGFVGVIAKPYRLGDLSQVLRQALGKEDPAPGHPPPGPPRDEVTSPMA
ncbi:MAG: response regulator [Deltaproteobacteria bacterium]|nr:response regulator [Deltaproteobacteria bacterium]